LRFGFKVGDLAFEDLDRARVREAAEYAPQLIRASPQAVRIVGQDM